MPLNRKWKCGILMAFLSLSLGLIFIPYQDEEENGAINSYSLPEGDQHIRVIVIPWRSHNQLLKIWLNVSMGKVDLEIMNSWNYRNLILNLSYTPILYYENVTFFDDSIHFEPPLTQWIDIVITAKEESVIMLATWFYQLLYYNNYGFFFLMISFILGMVYLYQIKHRSFSFR